MDFDRVNNRSSRVAGRYLWLAGLGALASGVAFLAVVGGVNKLFAQSYLFGYSILFSGLAGSLFVLVLHSLLSSNWGRVFQGFLEASASWKTWVVAGLAFIPVVLMMDKVYYKWIFPGDDLVVLHKTPFLNTTGWILRAIVYFGVLVAFAIMLGRPTKEGSWMRKHKKSIAAVAAVVLVLTVSLLSVDWYMSIEPHWFSTIYGVWLFSGYILSGLSLMALALWLCLGKTEIDTLNKTTIPKDIGNLLLAFTMFWSYISLSQYLIIWSGNLPEFNTFYLVRAREGWENLGMVLILGHFLIPFMALLSPSVKRNLSSVALVAIWILAMRLVDMFWNIAPLYGQGYLSDVRFLGAHVASAAFFACIWVLLVAYAVKQRGILNLEAVRGS